MRKIAYLALLASFGSLANCAQPGMPDTGRLVPGPHAEVRDANGALVARVTSNLVVGGIRWRIEAVSLPPGTYGLHIHQTGRCEGPGFTSAGPHWNPTGRQHGFRNPLGPHRGDLPNLVVDASGHGLVEAVIEGPPAEDADGASVVVHAAADDYRTDPSGNSGARIACGVLG